jgi:hypothetical protein
MAPSGIDPATFRFVAQCRKHCATVCPLPGWGIVECWIWSDWWSGNRVRETEILGFKPGSMQLCPKNAHAERAVSNIAPTHRRWASEWVSDERGWWGVKGAATLRLRIQTKHLRWNICFEGMLTSLPSAQFCTDMLSL